MKINVVVAILAMILSAQVFAGESTRYWELTEARVASSPDVIRLQDESKNVQYAFKKSQWVSLLNVKKKIGEAAGLPDIALVVSNDSAINAFATNQPNGRKAVIFTFGMLSALGSDENMMAVVMGHEFGHLAKNHDGRSARNSAANILRAIAGFIGSALVPGGGAGASLAGNAVSMGGQAAIRSFDRDQEREADIFGIEVMTKAGYDPRAAIKYWTLAGNSNQGGFFSTHPTNEERITDISRLVNQSSNLTDAPAPDSNNSVDLTPGASSPQEDAASISSH